MSKLNTETVLLGIGLLALIGLIIFLIVKQTSNFGVSSTNTITNNPRLAELREKLKQKKMRTPGPGPRKTMNPANREMIMANISSLIDSLRNPDDKRLVIMEIMRRKGIKI